MTKIFEFWRWLVGSAVGLGIVSFMAYQQHAATEMYKHHREEYCSTLSSSLKEQKACTEEGISARDYLPWEYELLRWPEGITAWLIVATGLFIGMASLGNSKGGTGDRMRFQGRTAANPTHEGKGAGSN